MRKVGDRLKEYIALIKLMTPVGKIRVLILGIEVFLILLLTGVGLNYISMLYVILILVLSMLYVMLVVIDTFK